MTPKEKAESIYYQFRRLEHDTSWIDNANAKRCARIFINEIIKALDAFGYTGAMYDDFETGSIYTIDQKDPTEYWKKVLSEIELL